MILHMTKRRTATRAVIYCRISSDPGGDELGVTRQTKTSRELCDREGFDVLDVFVDDDRSAYSGKPRPEFERLRERIETGDVDVLVAWHPDRLTRQPRELEDLIDLLEATKTTVRTVQTGEYDLATPSGRMAARIVGAVARGESEHKSARLRAKHRELAERGKISGGGHRPYGYRADRITLDRTEAKVIREVADRVLAGESIRGIIADLDRREIRSSTGKRWTPTGLRNVLLRARIAGLREHDGETFRAEWPAIVTEPELRRLRAILEDPARRTSHGQAPRLLTGIAVCSKCGTSLVSQPKSGGIPSYSCRKLSGGCGSTRIAGEPLDDLITEAVFRRFDRADLPAARPPRTDLDADRELVEIEARLVELGEAWADGELDRAGWRAAAARLEDRRREITATIQTDTTTSVVDGYVGDGLLRSAWPEMNGEQRRTVLSAVLDRVVIGDAVRGRNYFDPDRVSIDWKA